MDSGRGSGLGIYQLKSNVKFNLNQIVKKCHINKISGSKRINYPNYVLERHSIIKNKGCLALCGLFFSRNIIKIIIKNSV